MTFLPRNNILSLEELYITAAALVENGVTKIRLTGGEPLVRSNVLWLVEKIASLHGLEELCMTTNGSQLVKMAKDLKSAGLGRINVSLDSLDAEKFRMITRTGDLKMVLDGIDVAIDAGFKNTKINSVILKNRNDDEVVTLLNYAVSKALDISYIEEMPLGEIVEHDRALSYCSSDEIREILSRHFKLEKIQHKTNGPSSYYKLVGENAKPLASKVGFISPHSHNFCGECNRIRITVEGRLLFCLGNEHSIDLKQVLRAPNNIASNKCELVGEAIRNNLHLKPERHYFDLEGEPEIVRFMNTTGG